MAEKTPRRRRTHPVGRAARTSPPEYFDALAADHAERSRRSPTEPRPVTPPADPDPDAGHTPN